jgi:hypothetical protein
MTITHLSHFDAELIAETKDNVIFLGTLAACRRLAFAHGMEVERYEGPILSSIGGIAQYASADAKNFAICWFVGRGMIIKVGIGDDYSLVMPVNVWKNK